MQRFYCPFRSATDTLGLQVQLGISQYPVIQGIQNLGKELQNLKCSLLLLPAANGSNLIQSRSPFMARLTWPYPYG